MPMTSAKSIQKILELQNELKNLRNSYMIIYNFVTLTEQGVIQFNEGESNTDFTQLQIEALGFVSVKDLENNITNLVNQIKTDIISSESVFNRAAYIAR